MYTTEKITAAIKCIIHNVIIMNGNIIKLLFICYSECFYINLTANILEGLETMIRLFEKSAFYYEKVRISANFSRELIGLINT